MTKDLQQKLKDHWESFTASEQKIASYLLHNMRDVPFETAASLSKRVGVSQMTVGRFLRNLGYEGVGDLKEELRGDASWRHLYKDVERSRDPDPLASHLEAEIRALTTTHALAGSREWKSVVKLLSSAHRVTVSSFHHGTFLGLGFAAMLQQVRPHVSFNSGVDGGYIDMLLDSTKHDCVVLIDMRRYFKQFRVLAEAVVERGIPLVLITDTECYWARELTPNVLMIQADRAWHSFSAYTSLFSLLTTAMVQEESDVMQRIGEINELRQRFAGYVGSGSGREKDVAGASRKGPGAAASSRKARRGGPRKA
ncbi:MurR/RpiR family transcriptional regulator [Dyella solisilvae]|uniref:MurR/RpiR family transcriptional regulator n=1 Tax=Dyella solisilvae TaxID=1920168 RepID=A0A370KCM6_9GAMM|nr:MurR/RpiR family transcriptional regulator [Dyella solisilvae]RDJ00379.1 MurR/RpiR family transcriptional regulator [Dyella solisilvae]